MTSIGVASASAERASVMRRRAFPRAIPYVLSVASVAVALFVGWRLDRSNLHNVEFPLFLLAVASTAWYPGVGPAIVSSVLSALAFDYFFLEPRFSLWISAPDLPYYASFLLLAAALTQRKRREEQIRTLNAQLEKKSADLETMNNELEAFAYSISHDLRAPLRHMVGFAELLQKGAGSALDEKSRRYTATILDAAKRMGNLIDDLLAFSRIGRAETHETTVSLEQVVQEAIDEMRPEAAARNIAWTIGALPRLHGDRAMLRLVFVNLIANALKFTRTRAPAEIEIGSFDDPRRGLIVFVKDNGVGFDMKYSNKLFRVFQRLHRSEEFEGTGIGLATVQRVIHRHGGTVWADSSLDGGATFFFSVPLTSKR